MIGIWKSTAESNTYFVIDSLMGIYIKASGTLKECRDYCRANGYPLKVLGEY